MSSATLFCASWCLLLLTACGQKSDGTAYGVNPNKLPDGQHITKTASDTTRFRGNKIPKAGELNAITNGARSGQPITTTTAQ